MHAPLQFEKRLERIAGRRKTPQPGNAASRRSGHRWQHYDPHLPLRGLIILTLGALFFKALVLASIGPAAYEQRLDVLRAGTFPERAAAWPLQRDPVTRQVAALLRPLF